MTSNSIKLSCGFAALVAAAAIGCDSSPYRFASVSGVVKLNGDPLPGATVRFQPQRQGDSPLVGPSSSAVTDSEGRFTLEALDGHRGAVVGPHVVSVSTYAVELVDPKNSDRVRVLSKEVVPKRYRSPSELTYDVPSGGDDQAVFDLSS